MRKVLLNVAVALDGFIAGPNGEYDWCFTDGEDYGLTEFMHSIDCVVMGRKSYDLVVQYGEPFPEKKVIVFSRTLTSAPFDNVQVVRDDIPSFVNGLTKKEEKNIWLFGGAAIVDPLFEKNLIDEMHLSIHPIILGEGIPLFKEGVRRSLELIKSIAYPSGLVQSIYKKI